MNQFKENALSIVLSVIAFTFMINAQNLVFALSFTAILLCKEFGQWQANKKYNMPHAWSYPLPFPFPFGCLGSFTAVKQVHRNKEAQLDVFTRGILYAFALSVVFMLVGLKLSTQDAAGIDHGYQFNFGKNLVAKALHALFGIKSEAGAMLYHPFYSAGLAGTFTSALSLLPIGQLNGGYAVLSFLGKRYVRVSFVVSALVFVLGFTHHYVWWLILSVYLLFTYGHHDQDLLEGEMKEKSKKITWAVVAVFFLGIMLVPYTFSL